MSPSLTLRIKLQAITARMRPNLILLVDTVLNRASTAGTVIPIRCFSVHSKQRAVTNVHKAEGLPEAKRGEPCLFSIVEQLPGQTTVSIHKHRQKCHPAYRCGRLRGHTTASPKNFDYVRRLGVIEPFGYRSKMVVKGIIEKLGANGLLAQLLLATDQWLPCIDIIAVSKESKFVSRPSLPLVVILVTTMKLLHHHLSHSQIL
jgi:hypothetical protein